MLTSPDNNAHAYFRTINLNRLNDHGDDNERFDQFFRVTHSYLLPINIFARLLTNAVKRQKRQLSESDFHSFSKGATHLDFRIIDLLLQKWTANRLNPSPFELMRNCFEVGARQQLKALKIKNYGPDTGLKQVIEIIETYPHLELLEFPIFNPDHLYDFALTVAGANINRERLNLRPLVFRTSVSLLGDSLEDFEKILLNLETAKVNPRIFQIEVEIELFHVFTPSIDYSTFLLSDRIRNSPYIFKYIGLELLFQAGFHLFTPKQKEKLTLECNRTLIPLNTPLFLSQVKEYLNSLNAPADTTEKIPIQPFFDFFRMSVFSKIEINSIPDLTQENLNTILSLNIHELELNNIHTIRTINSDTVTSLTCRRCNEVESIQLPFLYKDLLFWECPKLVKLYVPNAVKITAFRCNSLTEFSNSSIGIVKFQECESLKRVDVPGAMFCEILSCRNVEFISARTAYHLTAKNVHLLKELDVTHAKKIELMNCYALMILNALSATKLIITQCEALEYLDAPLHKGILRKSDPSNPHQKVEEPQTHILGPNFKHINLPLFRGKLLIQATHQLSHFNLPMGRFEPLAFLSPDVSLIPVDSSPAASSSRDQDG